MLKINVDSELGSKLGLEPGEYELHQISKGVIALSYIGPVQEKGLVSQEQLSVLKKLSAFRFEKRIPFTVNKSLNETERKILEGLIERGVVELYREGKYAKTGVYNISKKVFPLLYGSGTGKEAKAQASAAQIPAANTNAQQVPQKTETKAPPMPPKLFGMDSLSKFGYAIIENEFDARCLSSALEKQIRAGDYLGVRAFNKKYYIAEKHFYVNLSERIRRVLAKKDASSEQLATELKVPEGACTVALTLMNNESEVIEKKRGMYGLV